MPDYSKETVSLAQEFLNKAANKGQHEGRLKGNVFMETVSNYLWPNEKEKLEDMNVNSMKALDIGASSSEIAAEHATTQAEIFCKVAKRVNMTHDASRFIDLSKTNEHTVEELKKAKLPHLASIVAKARTDKGLKS